MAFLIQYRGARFCENNKSSSCHSESMSSTTKKFLNTGIIFQVSEVSRVVIPLTVLIHKGQRKINLLISDKQFTSL